MANEITVNVSLSAVKGSLSLTRGGAAIRADMAGTHGGIIMQTIGFAADEALDIHADIANKGYAYFRNLDASNYVEIGVRDGGGTFIPFARLKPGEPGAIRLVPTTTYYAKANTAAVVLEHTVTEA